MNEKGRMLSCFGKKKPTQVVSKKLMDTMRNFIQSILN